jgi:cell division septal protein FtsQ
MSTATVALTRRTRAGLRVLSRRLLLGGIVAAALFALYMLWFRDSSLVAVKTVRFEGVGKGDGDLERALTEAARKMTTLHVRQGMLADAARPFPTVKSVSAEASFPSSLTIHVVKRPMAALIGSGSDAVAVAADGTILRGLEAKALQLPRLPLSSPPKGGRLRGPVLEQAQVLGAAPPGLRRYIDRSFNGQSGIGVELDGGVDLVLGDASRAPDKWRAAAAVLSDPGLGPLDYVDLSVPDRPAVGGAGHSPPPLTSG